MMPIKGNALKRRIAAVAILLLLPGMAQAALVPVLSIDQPVYYAASQAGGYSAVPIGTALVSHWRAMRVLTINNVKAGDRFLVTGKGEVNNDQSYGVEFVYQLTADNGTLGTSYDDDTPDTYGIPRDTDANDAYGQGIDVYFGDAHYLDWDEPGVLYVAPTDMATLQFIVWMRCRATSPGGTDTTGVKTTQQWLNAIKFPRGY